MRDVTNWKGSYRVPVRFWRGPVQPHSEINDIISAEGWVQTLMAAAGEPDIQTKLLHAYNTGDKSFKGASRRLRPARRACR